jgi:hypothetical protein
MAKKTPKRDLATAILLLAFPIVAMSQQHGITLLPGSNITATDGSYIEISDGSFVNGGSFSAQGESTVAFSGNTIQEIGGTVPTIFSNLTNNNNAGLGIAGEVVSVRRILLCNGLLETNGKITLLSGGDGTALIDGAGSGTITGDVTMQRYLPSGFGYRYLSSPFLSATVSEYYDEAIESIYGYDENRHVSGTPASGWVYYDNPVNTLVPMSGYAINFGSDPGPLTLDVSGEVNEGDLSVAVYNHDHPYTTGFNLVGNPYPSPVDWNRINLLNTNIDDAVYYFSSSTLDQYGGTYATYINGISSDGLATNIIPSMQGFFIHVTDGSFPVEGRLAMNNSVRINNLDHPLIKSTAADPPKILRLSACFSNTPDIPDHTVIYFDLQATPDFDGQYDALKLLNTDISVPNIFSVTPGAARLSISGMPPPAGTPVLVPLGVVTRQDGNIVFRVSALDPSFSTMKIHLIDSVAGITREITLNSEYSISLKSGEHLNRFYLKFAQLFTSASRPAEDPGIIEAFNSCGVTRLTVGRIEGSYGVVRIYDLSGRLLKEWIIRETGSHDFAMQHDTGIYIITYQSGNIKVSRKLALVN